METIANAAETTKGFLSRLNWRQGLAATALAGTAFGLGWTVARRRDKKTISALKAELADKTPLNTDVKSEDKAA